MKLIKKKNKSKATVKIPRLTMRPDEDYIWQYKCLKDRLNHPEKYSNYPLFENVEERIDDLMQWIYDYEKAHPEFKELRLSGYYEHF